MPVACEAGRTGPANRAQDCGLWRDLPTLATAVWKSVVASAAHVPFEEGSLWQANVCYVMPSLVPLEICDCGGTLTGDAYRIKLARAGALQLKAVPEAETARANMGGCAGAYSYSFC